MCGITFILSKNNSNVLEYIFNSLQLIQNRGYDSMGLCYYDKQSSNYVIMRKASTYKEDCYNLLKTLFIEKNLKSNIFSHVALGHTRWATHGGKTDNNAHPHISQKGNIILVHNGIINNYEVIKEFLIQKGVHFYSQTDSEVIANLIEYNLLNNNLSNVNNIEYAIKKTLSVLKGTWALVIIYTKFYNNFYVTRCGSPLLLGYNENYTIVTSETNGFVGLVNNYISLNDNNIISINAKENKIIKNELNEVNLNNQISELNLDNELNELDNNSNLLNLNNYSVKTLNNNIIYKNPIYEHWMIQEIMEQPETICKAHNNNGRICNNIIKLGGLDHISSKINSIEYVYLIGCGTSYNASLIGEQYLNEINKFIIVKAINASEFNVNSLPNIKNKSCVLCIFLSQSGETIDVYNCLKLCKNYGCINLGIINKVDSLIAREVDCGVYLNAGEEISVASTKSFTSMLVVLSLISMWFTNNNVNNINKLNNLRYLVNSINNILYNIEITKSISNIKDIILDKNINSIFLLGKNRMYPIACEGALKIKEVSYIHCEAFSAGALKHGPFALLDNTNITILLIDYSDNINYNNIKSTFYEIKGRNTNIICIINSNIIIDELKLKNNEYVLLENMEYYNEILYIIVLQLLAYYLSINKNINPDKPRNLAKVVTVE